MGFPVGTQVTVDNAIKMLMVKSANDMAVMLAEGIAGSIDNFSQEMTETAHRLGMSETNYVNPNGLPADGQITSARDLAILARALYREFPQYDFYWHIPAIKFGRRIMRNYNPLLGRFPGADGMKTGFICASGFNLVATAKRDNKRLIAVVLGAPSGAARAVKAAEMLESGFAQNPLSWLTPSLGSVDALAPIDAAPPNLKDEMCGPHRKRPAAEDEDVDADASGTTNGADGDSSPQFSFLLSALRAPTPKNANLLSDLGSGDADRGLYRADAHAGAVGYARGGAGAVVRSRRKKLRGRLRSQNFPTAKPQTARQRLRPRNRNPQPAKAKPERPRLEKPQPATPNGRRHHPRRSLQVRRPNWQPVPPPTSRRRRSDPKRAWPPSQNPRNRKPSRPRRNDPGGSGAVTPPSRMCPRRVI